MQNEHGTLPLKIVRLPIKLKLVVECSIYNQKQALRVYFPNPQTQLPILMKDGNISLLPWGRRKEQEGNLSLGDWAPLDSINAGKWKYV